MPKSGEIAERFFADSVKTLERESIEREIARLNAAFVAEADEAKRREITKQIGACIQKRNRLKK